MLLTAPIEKRFAGSFRQFRPARSAACSGEFGPGPCPQPLPCPFLRPPRAPHALLSLTPLSSVRSLCALPAGAASQRGVSYIPGWDAGAWAASRSDQPIPARLRRGRRGMTLRRADAGRHGRTSASAAVAAALLLLARRFRRRICRTRRDAKGDVRGMRCSNVCSRIDEDQCACGLYVRSCVRRMHGACITCTALHATACVRKFGLIKISNAPSDDFLHAHMQIMTSSNHSHPARTPRRQGSKLPGSQARRA